MELRRCVCVQHTCWCGSLQSRRAAVELQSRVSSVALQIFCCWPAAEKRKPFGRVSLWTLCNVFVGPLFLPSLPSFFLLLPWTILSICGGQCWCEFFVSSYILLCGHHLCQLGFNIALMAWGISLCFWDKYIFESLWLASYFLPHFLWCLLASFLTSPHPGNYNNNDNL